MPTVHTANRQFMYSDMYGQISFDNFQAEVDDEQALRLVQMNPNLFGRTPFPA